MFGLSKLALASLALGMGLFTVGCASNTPPQSSLAPSTQGVTCTKCQVTWVKVPRTNGKGRIIGYTSRKEDICPDCMDAVTAFFNTGKLQHTCKTCGGTMEICEAHER